MRRWPFFDRISAEYAGVPNLLYEICNEPNGETTWSEVAAYAQQVIPVIRANSPDAVVVVGTPEFDHILGSPVLRPLGFDNVMYCFSPWRFSALRSLSSFSTDCSGCTRIRWGRGVISTAKKLNIRSRRGLTREQRLSYWSSVIYWYSPIKNLIYMLSPLLFAVFGLPVFRCGWLDLAVFWLPMFVMQDVKLRVNSHGTISQRWSEIYETSVMPSLLIPILKESLGISLSTFQVTDKSGKTKGHAIDRRSMLPFLILILLPVFGIVRVLVLFDRMQLVSMLILLFWLLRNLYILILYDRLPTLPQSYQRDFGSLSHLWQNIACRVARTI